MSSDLSRPGLWALTDFRSLWAASAISSFGTMLGALSLTALLYLDASAVEMGVLAAASSAPVVLFALLAGLWIDRLPRVPVMVAADLVRFGALATIPATAMFEMLHIEQLYAVAFVAGAATVAFSLAYRSALPEVVSRDRLVEANSALSAGESVAATASPAIGGAIVQLLTAPVAVAIDAATFLVSGVFLLRIRQVRPSEPRPRNGSARREAVGGFATVRAEPSLRAIISMVAMYSFFSGSIVALYALWVIDGLGFSASAFGLLMASGGIGSVVGAIVTERGARHFGTGRSIVVSYMLAAALVFLAPLAAGPMWFAFALLLIDQCIGNVFWAVHNIGALSMRQSLTPDGQLGRVNAAFLLASQGLRPAGALVAGAIASSIGVREALLVSAAGINLAGLWLVFSPLMHQRAAPILASVEVVDDT